MRVSCRAASFCVLVCLAATASASADARIYWYPCPADAVAGYSAAVMRCGRFEPGGSVANHPVRLRVTRLQARPHGPTPHPVIFVPGGPGDSGGQGVPALQAWRRFQQTAGWPRDLVIFDPRGTGLSTSRPGCPAPDVTRQAQALADCFRQLGNNTAARLDARAQVSDLHRLIRALGQGSAVIWAQSYGALIAHRLAAEHPADVQMMILESPVLHARSAAHRQGAAFRRRRRQLVAGCDRYPACRLGVPSLRATIDALIAALTAHPLAISRARPPFRPRLITIDGRTVRALLWLSAYGAPDDARVRQVLRRALYNPSALAALAAPLVALEQRQSSTAPVYWSTRCQFAPRLADAESSADDMPCRQWPVPRLAPLRESASLPVLVIAGTRDVLTPADIAARVVLRHPGWQFLPVEAAAHGVLTDSDCAQRHAARFMRQGGAWLGAIRCAIRAGSEDGGRPSVPELRRNDVTHTSR